MIFIITRRVILSLTILFFLSNPTISMADCGSPMNSDFPREARTAKALFIGKVTKKEKLHVIETGDLILQPELVHFHVLKSWKGAKQTDISIETRFFISRKSNSGSSMDDLIGYQFKYGETYLVVTEHNGMHIDTRCSLTRPLNTPLTSEDISIINSLGKPEKVFNQF